MNPNSNNETVNLNLPSPLLEGTGLPQTVEAVPNQPLANPESLSTPQNNMPQLANGVVMSTDISQTTQPVTSSITAPATTPDPLVADNLAANDSDRIEKEWVVKAKQIVESTRNDPYMRTKKIGDFRAEYMKKRYNKDIKVSEE